MKSFLANFSGELKKLSLKKKYFVFMIISVCVCIGFALVSLLIANFAKADATEFIGNMPTTILPAFMQLIMPLIAIMAVCDLFSSEYQDNSIKSVLVRPVTRVKVYSAKVLAVFSLCVTFVLCVFAGAAVCDLVILGNTDGILHSMLAYLLDTIPLFVIILMAALINQFTKGSTSAMFLCIIIYILAKIGGMFIPVLDSLLFTGYLQWHKLWLGIMLPPATLLAKCSLMLGYGITLFSIGYCMFLNREF